MATINQNFFAELLSPKAAKWSAGVAFDRSNGLPLDQWSVFEDKTSAESYLSNSKAYPGQVIAYAEDNGEMTVCVLSQNAEGTTLTLKPVGTIPVGDEKSIEVAEDGTISLKGVTALVFERDIMGEDGEPTGEKEEVQYQILMTKNGLTWVEPSKTTVEGLATLIEGLAQRVKALEDDRVTEQELADAIKDFATDDEVAAAVKVVADKLGIPSDNTKTAYELIVAEADRAAQAEEALGARIGAAKDGETAATGVYAYVDGVVNALVNGVDPDKIDSLNELIAWVEAHPDIVSGLDERLVAVEGVLDGFGGEEEPETVKGYIDAHIEAAEGKYATQDALAGVQATAEAAQTAGQVQTAITTALEDYYTAEEVDNKGYAVATDVERDYAKKTDLQTTDNIAKDAQNRVGIVEGKIDEITSVGGEPNVIEKIKVNGVTLEVEKDAEGKSTKTVSIAVPTSIVGMEGYTALDAKAQQGITDAAAADAKAVANAEAITAANNAHNALANIVNGADNADSHAAKLAALAAKDLLLDEEIAALKGIDTTLQGTVAEQGGKITALESKDAELLGLINGKVAQGAFDTLNAKVDTGDKNVSTYVADAITAAAYDDTAVKALITAEETRAKAEEERVAGLVSAEASRADTEEKRIVGLIEAEAARADAAEKANKALIDGLDSAIKAVLDNEGGALDSIKELATWVEEHETEVLPVIEQQGKDIAALTLRVAANETAVGTTLPAAIAAAEAAAKKYTDDTMVKADGDTIKNTNGTFSVQKVTTDMLVNGEEELILYGGNAGKKTEVTE